MKVNKGVHEQHQPDVSIEVAPDKEFDMKKTMMIIATISAIGISGLAQAAQESRPGQERMKSAYDAAVKKCESKKGDQREDCLKEAQEKKGAPAKTDVRKQDRIQPEPMKSDMKK